MALCVYHETTESTVACRVCKQDVCDKCLEYGEDGMCGMCLEMANARKASAEAARQARTETAAAAPGPRPRPPAPAAAPGPRPAGANTAKMGPGSGKMAPAGSGKMAPAGSGKMAPPNGSGKMAPPNGSGKMAPPNGSGKMAPPGARPPARPAVRPGMCAAHPDQKAEAACTHCEKKVCPYCLDLYDLCSDCRNLPSCARHESMVAQAKCVSCKMDYCKVCLNGSDQCDRCRSIGAPKDPTLVKANAAAAAEKKAKAARTTGELKAQPPGAPAGGGAKAKVKPADHIYRPPGAKGSGKGKAAPAPAGLPMPAIAGGVLIVFVLLGFLLMGRGKAALSDEDAVKYLQEDMAAVQKAAIAIEAKTGRYPDSEEAIFAQIASEGRKPESLPLPIKLSINSPAAEPLQISYRLVGDGFEVRAVDKEGRPFAVNGRDVVYTNQVHSVAAPGL